MAENRVSGGVTITSVADFGAMVFLGYDPTGTTDQDPTVFLPSDPLVKAAKGIKTAERELHIQDNLATVTTFQKEARPSVQFVVAKASAPFPPVHSIVSKAIEYWGESPALVETAGRYNLTYLLSAIKAMGGTDSIVMAPYPHGPLRLQRQDLSAVVLLMPQQAEPIPPVPSWLSDYASS